MSYTVAALLAGFRDGRLDPVALAREYGAETPAAAGAARRWQAGTARALEGIPVVATDEAARAFAEGHGAVVVGAPSAPLRVGGGAGEVAAVAKGGGAALLAPGLPVVAAPHATDLAAVLGALGQHGTAPATRAARIAGIGAGDAERKAGDLAASLLKGLGLSLQTLSVTGAGRLAAAAADADAVLLPLDAGLVGEAASARLAALALPGMWDKGARLGLLLVGANAVAVTELGVRLNTALGG